MIDPIIYGSLIYILIHDYIFVLTYDDFSYINNKTVLFILENWYYLDKIWCIYEEVEVYVSTVCNYVLV